MTPDELIALFAAVLEDELKPIRSSLRRSLALVREVDERLERQAAVLSEAPPGPPTVH
jgi:hypothetical protein